MGLYKFIRRYYKGVSWTNPTVALVLRVFDPIDAAVRSINGLGFLPSFSSRVRSNGMRNQFGGKRFYHYGKLTASLLISNAGLKPGNKVLEIGCGTGRTALALAQTLNDGNYTGMDIESYSLDQCLNNKLFKKKQFHFDLLDIYNREYNPTGKNQASEYKFPYADEAFDIIFMVSVFTHMLAPDTRNYIKEFSRMLKPGGKVFITTFLMDDGHSFPSMSFPFEEKDCRIMQKELPEYAVGYTYSYYRDEFSKHAMSASGEPLKGHWREVTQAAIKDSFPQDIVVFKK